MAKMVLEGPGVFAKLHLFGKVEDAVEANEQFGERYVLLGTIAAGNYGSVLLSAQLKRTFCVVKMKDTVNGRTVAVKTSSLQTEESRQDAVTET
eukprot:Skav206866  [mRNA]  locus=scaffold898:88311:88906:- [translate_table: standard]